MIKKLKTQREETFGTWEGSKKKDEETREGVGCHKKYQNKKQQEDL